MTRLTDDRLAEARNYPFASAVDRLAIEGLRRACGEHAGPCPKCGGHDRFSINMQKEVFNCRGCDAKGDALALVMHVIGLDLAGAVSWLIGDEVRQVSEEERAEMRKRQEERAAEQERYAAKARERARRDAGGIWRKGGLFDGSEAETYLALRLRQRPDPAIGSVLRFIPDHPYRKFTGGRTRVHQVGPAMIAVIQGPDGRGQAVHQTWIDLNGPKGKAEIVDSETGEVLPSKLVRGSKKGGAIRLLDPPDADTLVMGEGIETTLTAACARGVPGAAYWAGVDLGNMAGKGVKVPGQRHSDVPDMQDARAFVPPERFTRLIYIQDGDSAAIKTRAQLVRGLRRAMALRPGLRAEIVHAGEGRDLNDILE